MSEARNKQEEFALQTIFGRALPPVADEGFSTLVHTRLRQDIWRRRVVLMVSLGIGLLIGLPALAQFMVMISQGLTDLAVRAQGSESLGQFGILLQMLPLREGAEVVSEDLASFGAQLSTVSWYLQYKTYILAGLMAVLSLAMTRIIDR